MQARIQVYRHYRSTKEVGLLGFLKSMLLCALFCVLWALLPSASMAGHINYCTNHQAISEESIEFVKDHLQGVVNIGVNAYGDFFILSKDFESDIVAKCLEESEESFPGSEDLFHSLIEKINTGAVSIPGTSLKGKPLQVSGSIEVSGVSINIIINSMPEPAPSIHGIEAMLRATEDLCSLSEECAEDFKKYFLPEDQYEK